MLFQKFARTGLMVAKFPTFAAALALAAVFAAVPTPVAAPVLVAALAPMFAVVFAAAVGAAFSAVLRLVFKPWSCAFAALCQFARKLAAFVAALAPRLVEAPIFGLKAVWAAAPVFAPALMPPAVISLAVAPRTAAFPFTCGTFAPTPAVVPGALMWPLLVIWGT